MSASYRGEVADTTVVYAFVAVYTSINAITMDVITHSAQRC